MWTTLPILITNICCSLWHAAGLPHVRYPDRVEKPHFVPGLPHVGTLAGDPATPQRMHDGSLPSEAGAPPVREHYGAVNFCAEESAGISIRGPPSRKLAPCVCLSTLFSAGPGR